MLCRITLAFVLLLGGALAIDEEFPGYIHYRWASFADANPNNIVLTKQAFQTECDTLDAGSCFQMLMSSDYPADVGYIQPVNQDSSVDTYYKNSTCGDQCSSPVPTFVTGGLYAPNTVYMKCNGCKMMQDDASDYLNKYNMPPGQCATTCNEDKRCVAMTISNDRATCTTYANANRGYDAYMKVRQL